MRHLRTPSILGATFVLMTLGLAAPASAQVSLSVAPAFLELEGDAGDTGMIEIDVTNKGDEPFDVVTAMAPFQGMAGDRSLLDWSTVGPQHLTIAPGEAGIIDFSLALPDDAPAGGRYAAITVTTVPESGENTAAVAGQVVVPVFVTIRGDGDLNAASELGRSALFLEADGRLGARVEVTATGNVHVPFVGEVTVTDDEHAVDASLAIDAGRVLPGTTRTYATATTLPLPLDRTYHVSIAMGTPDDAERMTGDPVHTADLTVEATAGLALDGSSICETLDGGPQVATSLHSAGSLGLTPAVSFQVFDASGAPIAAAQGGAPALLWPGETVLVGANLESALPSGDYTLVTRASAAADITTELTTAFSIGGDPATAAPLCATPEPSPARAG